jgi:RimJ/RimL family protein N-acetyltransferase
MDGRFSRLEPLDPDKHARDLFAANAVDTDGANWTYLPYGPIVDFDEYLQWVTTMASACDPQFYAVILKSTGNAVGVASYLRMSPESGSIEVGHIHFSNRLKQTAAATEAMFLMMQRVFELGYRRYEWKCDSLNAPSRSAAQRLGFSFEGIFRQATVYKGRNRDTAWYAVIDFDWPRLESAYAEWLAPDNFDESGKQKVSLRDLTKS